MKKILRISSLIALFLATIFCFQKSDYLWNAIRHLGPDLDDYKIFENRIVKAHAPKAWRFHPQYAQHHIPNRYLAQFDKYETVAFLIIKDSAVYAEKYWDSYGEHSLSNSFSMAKSIISLLVGCAIDDGYIKSVDQPLSDFLPELTNLNSKKLTLRTLLTMSAATDWKEAHSSLFSITTEAYYGTDLWGLMKGLKLKGIPGKEFEYQSGVTQLLAFALQRAIKRPISDYASDRLWTPIHAENDALWSLDSKDGMEKAYCCFNSNARDFARLGQLILNKGRWDGRQIVSARYIEEAITPAKNLIRQENGAVADLYGFQFWTMHYKGERIPYLRGILGQYIYIIPSSNVVVVRLGNKRSECYKEPDHCPTDATLWLDAAMEMLSKK